MFGFGGGGSESQVPTGGKKGGVAARTDSSIDDEEAGRMRKELAARSKAKKAAEAARIKAENAELKKRFNAKTVEQRTDDNLDDEEAGRMRKVMAERSRQRRADALAGMRTANEKIFSRIASTDVRTDDDIMDEAAGKKRLQLRAEAKARRARETEELRQKNAAMTDRLKNAPARFLNIAPDGVQLSVPRSRDKQPEEMLRTIDEKMNGEYRPPSWLHPLEKYTWTVAA